MELKKYYTMLTPKEKEIVNKSISKISHYRISKHAHLRAREKNINLLKVGLIIDKKEYSIIEVKDNGKVLLRNSYSKEKEVCVVLDTRDGTIVTVWTNRTTDKHSTVDLSKYTDFQVKDYYN